MNIPKLPELSADIFVDKEGDELTTNDEDMSMSVNRATHKSEIKSKRKRFNLI